MKQLLLVFIGGGLGSMFRYLVTKIVNNHNNTIPYATLTANVLGCFFIGVILGLVAKNKILTQTQTLFIVTGFCGGLTTFSTFIYENFEFLKLGNLTSLLFYMVISLTSGLLAIFIGISLVKLI